ncbi:MAG: mechanosensitive ion channel [Flavobacteriales bacterium]|jgi:small-conductance mechanosensitive channel|nr:mechanosensitive ion channel [Flavobacteriales bacterium]NCG29606.1 mechanosensitive ion channel [Bacteroidota bacterium]MBT4706040.1 mechanosensitive ion channel [Flavobacteriales bacterium]MBT4931438.1 mechanosensitive ion channel [Flavobacteriales bacterium]MBT5131550.1 mechanosensitive ion channel [Flavobacteriales bacterium]
MDTLVDILDFELFHFHNFSITVMNIGMIVFIYFITWLLLRMVKAIMTRSFRRREWMEQSTLYALRKLVSYFAYSIATAIALESIGLDLTLLIAGSAALLVGIGLGIQQIFNDFTSGLIILFGGTVKVGDIVEFNQTVGKIIEIDFRTSKITTRDNITIIVPNSKLVSDNVINWTTMDYLTRFNVEVQVAYGSDTNLVRDILLEVVKNHPGTRNPKNVSVQFRDFGESGLLFRVLFWATSNWEIEFMKSDIRFAIDDEFRKNEIRIPFPQRDIHLFQDGKRPDQPPSSSK